MTPPGDASGPAARSAPKAPSALRTIGELAAETGVATHVLRYWERNVAALQPVRLAGGRRYYRPEDVALVRRLHQLVMVEGYTLEGAARAALGKAEPSPPSAAGARPPAAQEPAEPAIDPPPPLTGGLPRDRVVALRDRLKAALAA